MIKDFIFEFANVFFARAALLLISLLVAAQATQYVSMEIALLAGLLPSVFVSFGAGYVAALEGLRADE